MSLSIGQSQSYINNIENGVNYPSMSTFFYLCQYLGVTPKEFFDVDSNNPVKEKELIEAVRGLKDDQIEHLIALARGLQK